MPPALHREGGFSVIEMMLTVAVIATLMAMALPVMTDIAQSAKLNKAVRMVERELQSARLKAVSTNSILRVRTNCPGVGFVRMVEVINNAAVDNAANRCNTGTYPFPPTDIDLATRPNYDGPLRVLPDDATVTSVVLEFQPDGTVRQVVGNLPQAIAGEVTLTVRRHDDSKLVTINAVGKVQIQ
jgi:prepilin-type N-terminal cleavage/methylation domain-containing protein